MELTGLLHYGVFTLTMVGIYGVLALGLNVQWGYTGMLNIGVAAFYAVGAYTTAILTAAPSPDHLGGFGLPFIVGLVGAGVVAGLLALVVGLVTLNLRSDYLAIASIGIAEIVRLVLKNEAWMTNGVRGIAGIDTPLASLVPGYADLGYLVLVGVILALVYWGVQRAFRAPWGRVLRALRENEPAALAAGKNVLAFRVSAFVLGSVIMGLGGALYAHFNGYVSPSDFQPMLATFLVWVMLIAGGSGNNRGALLGALVIWLVWSGTEMLAGLMPEGLGTQASALRVFLVGLLLEIILLTRPQGLLPEKPPRRVDE